MVTFFEWYNNIKTVLQGVTGEQWRIFFAITASLVAIGSGLGFWWGRVRGWHDRRHNLDRDNVGIYYMVFRERPDNSIAFWAVSAPILPTTAEVFGSPHLQSVVQHQTPHCIPGNPLFDPGEDHYLAMSRVDIHITGCDATATQCALAERHDDYNVDMVSVMLTAGAGEDGIKMPLILVINPARLSQMSDAAFLARLKPLRFVHGRYLEMLKRMAVHQTKSIEFFKCKPEMEVAAGSAAAVWTVPLLTQKILPTAPGAPTKDLGLLERLAAVSSSTVR